MLNEREGRKAVEDIEISGSMILMLLGVIIIVFVTILALTS